jgi:protein-export membrane protein SecD
MKKEIIHRFLYVVGVTVFVAVLAVPPSFFGDNFFSQKLSRFKITLGLDLAGGTELDYKIDLSEAIAKNKDDDPQNNVDLKLIAGSVRDSLEERVNPAGVGEIIVKLSEMNGEQHVLIQMPPSSNVAKAKHDAERNNKLEFFEEDPFLEAKTRMKIEEEMAKLSPANFKNRATELATQEGVSHEIFESRFPDEIHDQKIKEKLEKAAANTIIQKIIETQTELEYKLGEDGNFLVTAFPEPVLAIVKVDEKTMEEREKTIPAEAEARHILFAWPGAEKVAEDVPYKTKAEARIKANEVLAMLQDDSSETKADFAKLAGEFSTESNAKNSGGNLGKFTHDKMVPEFANAVFDSENLGLLPEIVESKFGFHIIEILSRTPERKEKTAEQKITYEMIAWNKNEIIWLPTDLGGEQLENASVGFDGIGSPLVNLFFDNRGADLFAELTDRVSKRKCDSGACRLGIKVGGAFITTPTVRQKIIGRSAQISGSFTYEEAQDLAYGLNLGAIDAPVELSGQMTIQPELGAKQLQRSYNAAILGFVTTLLFMLISYRLAGLIAGFALVLYATSFIVIIKTWPESFGGPIVMSLAGIAGVALSIGLAVDGNILIFERMKEEFARGKNLREAADLGFEKAWTAIRDSNLTTLLTCIILFSIGSSVMKGFAITLIVGTLLSMFTAITVSRNILRFVLLFEKLRQPWLFGINEVKKKD